MFEKLFTSWSSVNRPDQGFQNIVVITIDALRPDHLGCYGYPLPISPHIDALASEGIIFKRAVSQASWTWPSLNSLQTAGYPLTHGVYFWDQRISPQSWTIIGAAKECGYKTAFFSNHGGLAGFNPAFDLFVDARECAAEELSDQVLSWLKTNRNHPFVAWIHYMEAHDGSLGLPECKQQESAIDSEERDRFVAAYDAAITGIDAQICRLKKGLAHAGVAGRTLIVLMSDHGQELLEHGIFLSHGSSLWDSLLHIPCVLAGPGIKPGCIGQTVQAIDIMATVCRLSGIPIGHGCDGRDVCSLAEGQALAEEFAFSEHREHEKDLSSGKWVYDKQSLVQKSWKIISHRDGEGKSFQLFNLAADPREQADLYRAKPAMAEFMRLKLDACQARSIRRATPPVVSIDSHTRRKLESLGYLQ